MGVGFLQEPRASDFNFLFSGIFSKQRGRSDARGVPLGFKYCYRVPYGQFSGQGVPSFLVAPKVVLIASRWGIRRFIPYLLESAYDLPQHSPYMTHTPDTQTHTHKHAQTHTETDTDRQTHTHARVHTHAHTQIHAHTQTHTHTHTHTRTHTHTHTHTCDDTSHILGVLRGPTRRFLVVGKHSSSACPNMIRKTAVRAPHTSSRPKCSSCNHTKICTGPRRPIGDL